MTFSNDFAWSLEPANTSTAVTLLSAVWPACSWVTTCATTDQAGVDLLGLCDGRQPIRVDLKHRRVNDARRKFFDATDPDAIFDVEYQSSDGQRRTGPVRRYDGHRTLAPCDWYAFVYPSEEPAVGLLVDAQAAHHWLAYEKGLYVLTSETRREDGLKWSTSFVATPASLLNACAGRGVARVLTTNASEQVAVTYP